jgi:hypothetical protein
MQVKDGYSGRLDIDQDIREAVMLATIAANMCLQGGEPVDVTVIRPQAFRNSR